jgi:hypothetical protein
MDHHPGRLVDHRQVIVLIKEVERNRLRFGIGDVSLRDLELDHVTDREFIGGIGRPAVDASQMALDQARRG